MKNPTREIEIFIGATDDGKHCGDCPYAVIAGEVVSGCCRGVDRDGELWAESRGIPVERFPADWSLGRKAGPLRNAQMAEYATAVILFPGGRGTASMRRLAIAAGLRVIEAGAGEQLELA